MDNPQFVRMTFRNGTATTTEISGGSIRAGDSMSFSAPQFSVSQPESGRDRQSWSIAGEHFQSAEEHGFAGQLADGTDAWNQGEFIYQQEAVHVSSGGPNCYWAALQADIERLENLAPHQQLAVVKRLREARDNGQRVVSSVVSPTVVQRLNRRARKGYTADLAQRVRVFFLQASRVADLSDDQFADLTALYGELQREYNEMKELLDTAGDELQIGQQILATYQEGQT